MAFDPALNVGIGGESFKVRYEVAPYARGRGIDIGCGPGRIFNSTMGFDLQPWGGDRGPNVIGNAQKLSLFADEVFDYVYSSHLLEELQDTRAVLTEWWRLVKPGGNLILYLPHRDLYPNVGHEEANPEHVHDFLPGDIVEHMRAAAPDWELLVNDERNQLNEYSFLQVYKKTAPGTGHVESWDQPKPEKTACVVRYGAFGDALWASSILPWLKEEGYHVTVITQESGEQALRHDPHIDRLLLHPDTTTSPDELLGFWMWWSQKFDRWINLVGSVETRLLPAPNDVNFFLEDEARRRFSSANYLETVHDYAGAPHVWRQKFYPNDEEREFARTQRARFGRRLVVVNPGGSTAPKWWPYTTELARLLHEQGVDTVMLGDLKGKTIEETPGLTVIGKDWAMRQACAFALLADVVVGTESAIVNAVAFDDPLKIVILGHSTEDNLTKHWPNTVSVSPDGLPCYPCHRLHPNMMYCVLEKKTQTSACHAIATPDKIAETIAEYWRWRDGDEAA